MFFKKSLPNNSKKAVFVIAAPRSGTTWLSKVLNAHPELYCTENRLFGNYADFIQDDAVAEPRLRVTLDKYINSISLHTNSSDLGLSRQKFQKQLTGVLIESLFDFYNKKSGNKQVIDKITPYVGTSELVDIQLKQYFTRSKLVYLLRDGRDVCTSGVFHWLKKRQAEQEYSESALRRRDFFLSKTSCDSSMERFFTDAELEEWAQTWAQPLRTFYVNRNKKPHLVRYEDMLSNMEAVLSALFKFLDVSYTNEITQKCINAGDFKQMSGRDKGQAKPGAHVRKGISGDWRNYFTQRDGEIFNQITDNLLFELGYETNHRWFQRLPKTLN